jgi:hypothetical protein
VDVAALSILHCRREKKCSATFLPKGAQAGLFKVWMILTLSEMFWSATSFLKTASAMGDRQMLP